MTKHINHLSNKFGMLGCCLVAICFLTPGVVGQNDSNRKAQQHAQAAQEAQRAGDFVIAIREFTIVARLLPDMAEVHSNLGVAYYFNKQPQQALIAFEKALQLKPDLLSALIFSGIANYELSRPSQATKLLERAIQLSPADLLARTWLAHSYAAQSRYNEALEHFLVALERSPSDVDILFGLGQVYLELGRQEVEQLTRIAPNGARVLQLAGDLSLLRGETDKALALYQKALERRSDLVEVQKTVRELLGQDQRSLPEKSATTPTAQPVLSKSPEDKHYLAGTAFRERAQNAFTRIASIGADSYRAHQVVAESLVAQEKIDEALVEYRAVLDLKPDLAGIHEEIGDLLMSAGRATEALEEYRAELLLRPNDSQVFYRMGRALIVLGKGVDAEGALNRALALEGCPSVARKELGRIYVGRGEAVKAVHELSTYLESSANDAQAHYLLMRAYRIMGNSSAAEHHLEKFKRLSDDEKQRASARAALSLFGQRRKPEQ